MVLKKCTLLIVTVALSAVANRLCADVIIAWGSDGGYGVVSGAPSGSDYVDISAGQWFCVALRSDGSIVAWGDDIYGIVSSKPSGTGFEAIAAGLNHSLALASDGSIVTWGQPSGVPPSGTGYKDIAGGGGHSLALDATGAVVGWGLDANGQVSDAPAGNGFLDISAGGWHSIALKGDGSLVSWGIDNWSSYDFGQVRNTPAGNDFVAVAAGYWHSLALKTDGSIVSWGHDGYGQVSETPSETGFIMIAANFRQSMALTASGSIVSWGEDPSGRPTETGFTDIAPGFGWAGGFSIALKMPEPQCGNNIVEAGEACDDGNAADCDGCRGDCLTEEGTCGDGTLDPVCEVCDDGNISDGDCCSSICQFELPTSECRAAADECDQAEFCTGVSASCPVDIIEPATTECRPSAGACDIPEHCDGTSKACPADLVEPVATECRSVAGLCDVPEFCDGSSIDCPADAVKPDTVECRPVTGLCDIAENCTGSSAFCPADAVETPAFECRPVAGPCDVPEFCTGSSPACPTEVFLPDTFVCRPLVGVCDAQETCTGSSADCPSDRFLQDDVCRPATGTCDVRETCPGDSATCPSDAFVEDGTPCPDEFFCNGAETCVSGVCQPGSDPCSGQPCDEENDRCEPPDPPVIPPYPHDARKNRYISFNPNSSETSVALSVDLSSLKRCNGDLRRACRVDADCPSVCNMNYDAQCETDIICGAEGPCIPTSPCVEHPNVGTVTKWVDQPFESSCLPLDDCDGQMFAHLRDDPLYREWPESVLHVTDCEIVPVASYEVRATVDGTVFSDSLTVGTIKKPHLHYSDVCGPAVGDSFTPPDGFVNVTDVQAYLIAIQGGATAPHTTWVDVHGVALGTACIGSDCIVPQQILNVGDLQTIKFGYLGQTYAETPGQENPGDCP